MATGTMQMLLCYKYRMQRNCHRIMQIVRASKEKREHRFNFWMHEILRRIEKKDAYYHLVRELQFDAKKHHQYFRMLIKFLSATDQNEIKSNDPRYRPYRLILLYHAL